MTSHPRRTGRAADAGSVGPGLNAHQIRHVVSRLAHVDRLLGEVERLARGETSAFSKERPDIAEAEAEWLRRRVEVVRRELLAVLARLGIDLPEPSGSARRTAATAFTLARIELIDLNGRGLRGFGDVDPLAAARLERALAGVVSLLGEAEEALGSQEAHPPPDTR